MDKNRLAIMLCLLVLSALSVSATEFYTPPVVSAPLVATPPTIDGQIEPGEWSEAAVLSDFIVVGGAERPKVLPPTLARLRGAEKRRIQGLPPRPHGLK